MALGFHESTLEKSQLITRQISEQWRVLPRERRVPLSRRLDGQGLPRAVRPRDVRAELHAQGTLFSDVVRFQGIDVRFDQRRSSGHYGIVDSLRSEVQGGLSMNSHDTTEYLPSATATTRPRATRWTAAASAALATRARAARSSAPRGTGARTATRPASARVTTTSATPHKAASAGKVDGEARLTQVNMSQVQN